MWNVMHISVLNSVANWRKSQLTKLTSPHTVSMVIRSK